MIARTPPSPPVAPAAAAAAAAASELELRHFRPRFEYRPQVFLRLNLTRGNVKFVCLANTYSAGVTAYSSVMLSFSSN